ncbi:MAG: 2Fe-2S iron-sulfur cluster-binding protein [Kofleriaceae bacterium]
MRRPRGHHRRGPGHRRRRRRGLARGAAGAGGGGGAQCGIRTPGIAVCAAHVVDRRLVDRSTPEAAARATVRELLAGNICRCTGYQLIVDAIVEAAREVAP